MLIKYQEEDFNPLYWRSFKGIASLYGINALGTFAQSQVIIIGVGGVGSWAVESLARSGIGSLVLVDADDICISNINRQLPALHSTKGDDKTEVLAQRCKDINPNLDVKIIDKFLAFENMAEIICPHPFTAQGLTAEPQIQQPNVYVIDAIDNAEVKANLINFCRRNKYKLVVCGAAGGKYDPSKISLADLTQTSQDPLIANVRNRLRREFGYRDRFKDKKFNVPTVYSSEQMSLPEDKQACDLQSLNCNNGYGSATVVTATFANFAVAKILELIKKNP
ncbi:tRNA threonylcarbamoyladenosine dehydratase [Psittacicella gerlachiana]|uniref:THIF-type NAD/FAD binding fold domain-containing protein n=1 Tax=Psittacicella gerlachiana TaxID=2028574 RepID=A0A3A1Y6X0_9GAMM|nr:tRNA threonylcarbamoyladenosine dehydratase [Psittacicella gerlachiana]RIY34023.1 hypothetical protein CKF59_05865 [Psittacicella gerlachiana]